MSALVLEIVGELPENLSLSPLQAAFAALRDHFSELPEGIINLAFVDDAEIQKLNVTFSGNDYPTDVLSFDYREDGGPIGEVIGEIAISIETARRQALDAKIEVEDEVALLGLHGVLHLLGFDHANEADQAAVAKLQTDLLAAAGVTYREFKWES